MGIAVSLFLFAIGAILTFATNVSVSGLDLDVVGVILMLVGIVGFVLSLVVWGPRRRALVRASPVVERQVAPGREVVTERPAAPGAVIEERRLVQPAPVVQERRYRRKIK
ncbi:MAG TPA: DUF6458 family protein [Mycobacteriales bacterium]|jgi:hypothetical protein|nr:DUF6458 family protein [Mycobacteriales bacterium]